MIALFSWQSAFAYNPTDFVISAKTDNAGSSADDQFIIPINTNYTYKYDVDCNDDGVFEATDQTGSYTCDYAGTSGTYTVVIKPSAVGGSFPQIFFNGTGDKDKIIDVVNWGNIQWASMAHSFEGCSNLRVTASDSPDLSNVLSMRNMFHGASSLTASFNSWDTSNVTDMSWLFRSATNFNGDISGWNTANVTTMSGMFYDAENFNQDISGWNTANVTNMSYMFRGAEDFNSDISGWNTSNVTTMYRMFYMDLNFNQDISGWDTSNVTNMAGMFYRANNFTQDIGGWNTASVTDMSDMFEWASNFNSDLTGWDTSNVTNMSGMFAYASNFNGDISGWDTSSVTTMAQMFFQATNFNQDLTGWDTSHVTTMARMFEGAINFDGDISSWDTSSLLTTYRMFHNATNFNGDISGWNTANVIEMHEMFVNATSFNQNIGGWNTANVTNMRSMFHGATHFNQDISGWNTANVTDMSSMFQDASDFNQDIGGWNTASVTDMHEMFYGASSFNQDISGWNTSSVTDMSDMFHDATYFDQDIGGWDITGVTDMTDMFTGVMLSRAHYDALLNGWAAQGVQNNVTFSGGNSYYCAGESARNNLTDAVASGGRNWTISDNGKNCNNPTLSEFTPVPTPTNDNTPTYTYSYNGDGLGQPLWGGKCHGYGYENKNSVGNGNNGDDFMTMPDGVYDDCTLTVIDSGSGGQATINVTPFTVDAVNEAPVITSDGGGATASVSVNENTTSVTTVVATDADLPANTLTYSITGGDDQAKFSIDSSSGALSFVTAPDFENPTDVDSDNVYIVEVTVTDTPNGTLASLSDSQTISVSVVDVNESSGSGSGGSSGSAGGGGYYIPPHNTGSVGNSSGSSNSNDSENSEENTNSCEVVKYSLKSDFEIPSDWFSDVKSSYNGFDALMSLAHQGVVSGSDDLHYAYLGDSINRAEVSKIISIAREYSVNLGEGCNNHSTVLTDIEPSEWFYGYVKALEDKGIIQGYPDHSFRPGNLINLAETYKVLAISFNLISEEEAVKDAHNRNVEWYIPYAEKVLDVISLPSWIDKDFGHQVTRAEFFYMLDEMMKKVLVS